MLNDVYGIRKKNDTGSWGEKHPKRVWIRLWETRWLAQIVGYSWKMKQEANAAEFSDGNVMNPSEGFVGHPAPVAMSAIQLLYFTVQYRVNPVCDQSTGASRDWCLFWLHSFLSWAITKTMICCMPDSHWTCVCGKPNDNLPIEMVIYTIVFHTPFAEYLCFFFWL